MASCCLLLNMAPQAHRHKSYYKQLKVANGQVGKIELRSVCQDLRYMVLVNDTSSGGSSSERKSKGRALGFGCSTVDTVYMPGFWLTFMATKDACT